MTSKTTSTMKITLLLSSLFIGMNSFSQTIIWGPEITVSDGSLYGNYRPRATVVDGDVPLVIYGKGGFENIFISRWNGTGFDTPMGIIPAGESSYIAVWTGPDVASKGDTVVAVFKLDPLDEKNVYSVRSVDGGLTFSDTIRVDSHNSGIAWMPSIEMDADGNPVVASMIHDANWANPRYALTHSSDAGLTYNGEVEVASSVPGEACDCCSAEVAIDGQRQLLLFRNNEFNIRDIFGVLSTDGGATFPTYTNIDNMAWQISGCPSTGADAIFMGDNLITTYASAANGPYRVYVSTSSTTSGLVFDTREMVTEPIPSQGGQNFPTISGANDTIVMAWMEADNLNKDIYYSVSVPGVNHLDALTNYKHKGNLTTTGTQTNPEIIYKNGIVHLFFQDNSTGNLLYRRGTIDLNLGLTENLASIGVYPNPSSNGVFYIQNDLNTELISVKNSIGQSIGFNIEESNGGLLLKLMTTSKGIYFLSYFTKDGIQKTTTLLVN
jgi:hypothetical protein